ALALRGGVRDLSVAALPRDDIHCGGLGDLSVAALPRDDIHYGWERARARRARLQRLMAPGWRLSADSPGHRGGRCPFLERQENGPVAVKLTAPSFNLLAADHSAVAALRAAQEPRPTQFPQCRSKSLRPPAAPGELLPKVRRPI